MFKRIKFRATECKTGKGSPTSKIPRTVQAGVDLWYLNEQYASVIHVHIWRRRPALSAWAAVTFPAAKRHGHGPLAGTHCI